MSLGLDAIQIDTTNEAEKWANKTKKQMACEQSDSSDGEDEEDNNMQRHISDTVFVCGLIINIERITKQQILKLRKCMPKMEYRQLKNRKSARECRKKRKAERSGMIDELK